MSIYKQTLGEQFYTLHPMLQRRYEFSNHAPFQAAGVMKTIRVGPKWFLPLFWIGIKRKLLFPEYGDNIPFNIINTPCMGVGGEEQIHWERIFYFKDKKRYFNALMSLDPKRDIIKDYLGEPSLLYSDLSLLVSPEGHLKIVSRKQRLVAGNVEIPLPKIFQGIATVTESYSEEKNAFQIAVEVRNPLIGLIFSYEGEFKTDEVE